MNLSSQRKPLLVSTNEAAHEMGFQPQTLRKWAMDGSGPIQPIKIGNRLRWKLKDIKKLCKAEGDE
ncbi:DNA-binding protein [Acinetobacter terrestris]|uniref:helix-turn-helix domain-containing protein n=1 Tax=Acinetobacter terrestris TaxID=2529843 RepID=UPI00103CBAB2|nr:helix-turn-helix domain-containing protein [Acinetobacter terrestris]TCB45161.1 DNA-binding protein [Acinetobacter terrestris]